MDEIDIYTQKEIKQKDLFLIFSKIPKEEKILFISERSTNKNLAISVRVILFMLVIFIFGAIFDFFSFKWINFPDLYMPYLLFYVIFVFIGYLIGKKYFNFRIDFYIIFTEDKFFILLISYKYKSPVLIKSLISKIQYYTIQKHTSQKSATIIIYSLAEEIHKTKLRRIKDFVALQKYFDSILFHIGKTNEHWLSKVRYDLPLTLKISKNKFYDVKRRRKNMYLFFSISIPIVIFIGVFLMLIFSDMMTKIFALLTYALFGSLIYGVLAVIYLRVWNELNRCSSLEEQVIFTQNEIEYNKNKIPLSKNLIISTAYISSRNTTQTPMNPKQSIYCLEIKDSLELKEKNYFGPIEDFQNYFKFIYDYLLDWKNKNGHLFSMEELYENEIKR